MKIGALVPKEIKRSLFYLAIDNETKRLKPVIKDKLKQRRRRMYSRAVTSS